MRRVIVQQLVSVDGFVADSEGGLDFHGAVDDFSESDAAQLRMLESVENVLLGATTYRLFVEYWPTPASAGETITDTVNAMPKTVVSSTLGEAPWGDHAPVTIERRDPVTVARELGDAGGVIVWGSVELTRALFLADAVDELHLTVIPVALGTGIPLLPAETAMRPLSLIASETYASGIVSLSYSLR